jgi:hypothetical protein
LGYVWVNLARCPYSDHAAIPKSGNRNSAVVHGLERFQEIPQSSVPIRPVVINLYLYSPFLVATRKSAGNLNNKNCSVATVNSRRANRGVGGDTRIDIRSQLSHYVAWPRRHAAAWGYTDLTHGMNINS